MITDIKRLCQALNFDEFCELGFVHRASVSLQDVALIVQQNKGRDATDEVLCGNIGVFINVHFLYLNGQVAFGNGFG